MASKEVSEQKKVQNGRKEKKKSDANLNRMFGIMKWSQSPGKKKMGSEYFVTRSGCFPHKHRENVLLKDNEQ